MIKEMKKKILYVYSVNTITGQKNVNSNPYFTEQSVNHFKSMMEEGVICSNGEKVVKVEVK